jgi:hypothetical protein
LWRDPVQPDEGVLLEDLRTRGDRQHPFWAVLESTRGPATSPSPSSRKAGKEGGAPR